jgi:hypothetical protein
VEGAFAFGNTKRVYHCGGYDIVKGFEDSRVQGFITNKSVQCSKFKVQRFKKFNKEDGLIVLSSRCRI